MQAIGGSNRAYVVDGKQLALLHIFHDEQRAPEVAAVGFAWPGGKLDRAESFLGSADGFHHGLEFLGFEGEGRVGATIGSLQAKMLLDDAGSEGYRDQRNRNAHGVIGKKPDTGSGGRVQGW